ncbi:MULTISPECIES: hypothetical protein [Streptomyces]|uniref:Uncharacterized protein n=2 Tax=Streptomyces TaxID=1883 RepID=A0A5N6A2D0_9ACTN|nr:MULTISPECIES: hypothetical protein [Streptomyces]KAB8162851.1 hypothetical protein FH607_019575 [Streptomyces mimosae]KAB8179064.1 hypothetical protein FH609_003710 [Streptomyces sp. 3MP-14]RMI39352.1 hypothetical protein EBN88_14935 [Streptomyces triticirhizae]
MAETNEQPTQESEAAKAASAVEVAAHAMAGAVLELQRLAPEKQAETALGAQSSGSCGAVSCIFDPA